MRNYYFKAFILLAACGNVQLFEAKQDARPPDAFSCAGSDVVCGDTCVDTSSSAMNCGACGYQCTAGESCQAGHCIDMVDTCAELHAINGSADSGLYTALDGHSFYCDMANPSNTYEGVYYGQSNGTAGSNFEIISLTDFGSATLQQAFVSLYNTQGGMDLIATWSVTDNCCMKYTSADANDHLYLGFGPNTVIPITPAGGDACNGDTTDASFAFELSGAGGVTAEHPSLATTFFTSFPPQAESGCVDSNNPAFFWKLGH